uniref:Uncharacterized protein n=1 Tax=Marseillevirus sp. TaxID=2809551 RepID=A0AA96ES13_9VIRU|nr:hypothetical protein MarFTMF_185 [Marseillevirus sp.]
MSLCIKNPFSLSFLTAFFIVEHSLDKGEIVLDELSKESIAKAKQHLNSPHTLYLLRKDKSYFDEFGATLRDLAKLLENSPIKDREGENYLSKCVIEGLPVADAIERYPQEVKDSILGLFLFWEKLPIDQLPESVIDILCK